MSYMNEHKKNTQSHFKTELFRFFGMALKFISFLTYIGCAVVWKVPYIPGFE